MTDKIAHIYGENFANAAHGTELTAPRRRTDVLIAETARRDAFEVIDLQGGKEIVHPEPEHWFWKWPFWTIMTGIILYFTVVFLGCSGPAPFEPVPTDDDITAARNTTERNLGRMLVQNDPALADKEHKCPLIGICWRCVGTRNDTTRTKPPSTGANTFEQPINILPWGFGGPPNGSWD